MAGLLNRAGDLLPAVSLKPISFLKDKMKPLHIALVGLVAASFCLGIWFYPITLAPVMDYLLSKEHVSIVFAIAVFLMTLSTVGIKKQVWIWPGIFVAYIICHQYIVPMTTFSNPSDTIIVELWKFKPMVYLITFYLFFLSLTSMKLKTSDYALFFKVVSWIGTISAIYMLFQWFGMDCFQHLNDNPDNPMIKANNITAFYGQPRVASAFLAMCLPAAVYCRAYGKAALILAGVLLSQSAMAVGALFLGFLYWNFYTRKVRASDICWLLLMCLPILGYYFSHHSDGTGRFAVWKMALEDTKSHAVFGWSWGAFPFLFPVTHHSRFNLAHNEWVELLYDAGATAVMLCMYGLGKLNRLIKEKSEEVLFLKITLLVALLLSCGLFVFQIEPHRYLIVMVLGLLVGAI